MNDAYYEQLVARKSRSTDIIIRILIIVLLVVIMVITMGLLRFFGVVITALLAFLAYYFIFPKLSVEYEYILLNHDMQIDAIYSKSKRKKLMNFDIQHAEIIAPKGSHRLNSSHPEKTLDYSSGSPDSGAFAIMIPLEHKNTCIIIEPDSTMINHIKGWMGSKFFMD